MPLQKPRESKSRRRLVRPVAIPRPVFLAAFAAWTILLIANSQAEDWPRWGGPRGDGTWHGPKLAASPVIWDMLVIVHAGAKQGCVMAFDRLTGNEAWHCSEDPAGYATPVVVDAPSGPQVVCWSPEHVIGISARTGKLDWSIPYKVTYGVSIATPLYANHTVFVTGYWEGSKAIRLGKSPSEATLLWEEPRLLRGLLEPPLYRDGHVYMIDRNFGLTCFEFQSGRKLWDDKEHALTARGQNPHASLTWLNDGDRAIILSETGKLSLAHLNPQGFTLEMGPTIIPPVDDKPIWAHPAYAGNCVFARNDAEIVCVGLPVAEQTPAK